MGILCHFVVQLRLFLFAMRAWLLHALKVVGKVALWLIQAMIFVINLIAAIAAIVQLLSWLQQNWPYIVLAMQSWFK